MKGSNSEKEVIKQVAKILVDYSCDIKREDVVIISADLPSKPLIVEIYKRIIQKGAYPRISWNVEGFSPVYYDYANEQQLKNYPKITEYEYKNADAFIYISAPIDRNELKKCNTKKIMLRQKVTKKLSEIRLKKKWVIFDWPTEALAKDAKMNIENYKKFLFNATLINWEKESKKWNKIASFINKSDKVQIIAKNTDLKFSIKRRKAIVGDGTYNMPDGEVFTAVVENSVNGKIQFTYPLRVMGRVISNIYLEFKDGKVIKFDSSNNKALKELLDTDKGARYIGEFAFGMNPKINKFTDNLLLDEKISGTIHFALGRAYKECKGKNKSAVHADIVKNMHESKIFFDGELAYSNGKFLI
ncbi:MAG: aminopeptidase [archaeon]